MTKRKEIRIDGNMVYVKDGELVSTPLFANGKRDKENEGVLITNFEGHSHKDWIRFMRALGVSREKAKDILKKQSNTMRFALITKKIIVTGKTPAVWAAGKKKLRA